MALSAWDNSTPTGSEAASSIDDLIKGVKNDIEERMGTLGNHLRVQGSTSPWKHAAYAGGFNIYDSTGDDVLLKITDIDSGGAGDGLLLHEVYQIHMPGTMSVAPSSVTILMPYAATLTKITGGINTAPTGANLTVDLYDGTTPAALTTSHGTVTITAGSKTGNNSSPTTPAITAGQWLTIDVTGVGSTVAGSDLTVAIETSRYISGS